jgi:tetratricopeptide (TPR) repeat protein
MTNPGEGAAKQRLETMLIQCDAEIGRHPASAAAHFRRATVLHGFQKFGDALQSYDRAVGIDPEFAAAWNNRARALRALRRLDEALESCNRAIALEPQNADAQLNLGNVLMELDRCGDALVSYERAIALKPDLAEAHYNRGNAESRLGRPQDAIRSYDHAIALRPGFAEAHHLKANMLEKLERLTDALTSYDRALARKPDFAESYNNRGNVLHRLGRLAESVESFTRAVRLKPGYALAWSNRASALKDMSRLEEALESCDQAIAFAPGLAAAHYARGNVLKGLKRLEDALQSFDRAIEIQPDFAEAHWNKAVSTLLMGDFERGWRLYEQRETHGAAAGSSWTGSESINGKTLFVTAEQGYGDTIQFCRYALLAAERGAKVTLAVQEALLGLLRDLDPSITIIGVGAAPPAFDYQISLLSMPLAFATRADTVPAKVPYLRADPDRISRWKERLGADGFKIGISWQGAVGGEVDIGRSFPARHFETLAAIPGVRLISLQKNAGMEQLRDLPAGMKVETFGDELDPGPDAFVDTAAVMENLDLVVTSDTAVAHLAGALGRPTWVALSHVPDWRWMLDRDDSPWYPTMKLFRQAERNNWPGVFDAMRTNLLEQLLKTETRR